VPKSPQRPILSENSAEPAFACSEGLRALLVRLDAAGPGAWRRDREAAELMRFAAERYAALARKHGLTAEDAAVAAFDAMLLTSTRTAHDPWAVVTVSVRATLIADERAGGMLTSTERARRPEYSVFHDAARFSDYESDLSDYHPAFRVPAADAATDREDDDVRATESRHAVEGTVEFLAGLGWSPETVRTGLAYICSHLADHGDRASAYEGLRRDKTMRAQLDLPHESWIGLLRITLGHAASPTMRGRRGTLLRLVIGESLEELCADAELVRAAVMSEPRRVQRS